MSFTNKNITPRELSYEEKHNREKGIYEQDTNFSEEKQENLL